MESENLKEIETGKKAPKQGWSKQSLDSKSVKSLETVKIDSLPPFDAYSSVTTLFEYNIAFKSIRAKRRRRIKIRQAILKSLHKQLEANQLEE